MLVAAGWLLAFSGTAMANMADPSIGVLGGDPPCTQTFDINVTNINPSVQPQGISGTTCYIITNNSGGIISSLDFGMTINTGLESIDGLNVTGAGGIFSIQQLDTSGYFKHTSLTYNDTTGDLGFEFFGVNKADGDEHCPGDCEINEQEGIPPGGIFTLELTGWVSGLSVNDPVQVYPGLPDVTSTFTTTPEPSTWLVLMIGFLAIAGVVELRRRRASRSVS